MRCHPSTLRFCLALSVLALASGTAHAQVPIFASTQLSGSTQAGVIPGPGGVFYGVTYDGGTSNKGTIYKVARDLSLVTVVHHFSGADGAVPYGELTLGTGPGAGKLFGTTANGGTGGLGTLFSFDLGTGTLTTLVTFGNGGPVTPLLQIGEYLYGSVSAIGPGSSVFRVKVDGTGYQTLKSFPAAAGASGWEGPDGLSPGALTLGTDGYLYGAATFGGDASCYPGYGCGTIFRLRPDGSGFSVLKVFTAPAFPTGFPQRKLVVSADGWLYGTTFRGVFRMRPSGTDHSMIYTLAGGEGSQIFSPPVEGSDGRLYVTQYDGGTVGVGRIFSILKDGSGFLLHHNFTLTGPYGPYGILYRDSAGTLVNTTEYSSAAGDPGTVFAIRGTNQEPIAIASAPSLVAAGAGCTASVTLDGSGSSDPDGDTLTYSWKEGGLTIATGAMPTVPLAVGFHTITLVVTDPAGAFDTMDVVVQVTGTAVLTYTGPALLQQFGTNLLSATLTFAGVPSPGVAITFTVNGAPLPPALTDAAGVAQVSVVLGGSGGTATVQIDAPPSGCGAGASTTAIVPVNRWPTIVATAPTPVVAGPACTAPVTLDATGTTDLDGDALTYLWKEGATTLATARTSTVTLGAGTHSISLTVSDGRGGASVTSLTVVVLGESTTVQYTGPVTFATGVAQSVTGLLRTGAGVPIAAKPVRFLLTGGIFTGFTNASGAASASVTAAVPGPATLRTEFLGDACYQPSAVNTAVTVTPPTATLIVTKLVVNNSGGTKAPGDFTMVVTGAAPVPATFPGSVGGTTVLLNPGAYSVSELNLPGYAATFAAGCSGNIAAGETKTCTVTNDDVLVNLTVTTLRAPASTAPGAAFTVTDTTANAGLGGVPPTVTRIWLSADKLLGGDTLLGARPVPALAGGTKSAGPTSVTLPALLPPGLYYLIAQADATAAVVESSEADNARTKTLIVGPDLVVSALTTTPAAPVSTTPTAIAVTTRNAGGVATGPTLTRLYRSANGKVDATDTLLATFAVPGLAPGATDAQSVTVTLPAGSYTLIAVCDVDDTEVEAREVNNTRRRTLAVP